MPPAYGNPYYTPEMFGAVGDGTTDDTAAFTAIGNLGRANGFLELVMTNGKTYVWTNPFTLAGIPYRRIRGEGANLMNNRARDGGNNLIGVTINYACFVDANPFWPNGAGPYAGGAQFGTTINSASSGAGTITVTSGACPLGPVLIYGFDRLGAGGFPPCPTCFEYNFVISNGGGSATGTLRNQLQHNYDSQWPSIANGSGAFDGPAKVLSCNANIVPWCQESIIEDLNFVKNPAFPTGTPPGSPAAADAENGAFQLSGTDVSIMRRCTAFLGNVTASRKITLEDCDISNIIYPVFGFQVDKCIELFESNDCKYGTLYGAGAAVKKVVSRRNKVTLKCGLFPIEHLECENDVFACQDQASAAAAVGNSTIGSAKVRFNHCVFVPPTTVNRIMESHIITCVFQVVSVGSTSTTIAFGPGGASPASRNAYLAAQIMRVIRIGTILRNAAGFPAFRVTRMPYTTGDPVTGDVLMDGDNLSNFSSGDTLAIPCNPDVENNNGLYDGSFASQLTSFWGNAFFLTPYPQSRTRDRYISDNTFRITSDMNNPPQGSNVFRMQLGTPFMISAVVVEVSRAAVSGGTVGLNVQVADAAGTLSQVYQSVDLKTIGRRTIATSGFSAALGADVQAASGLGVVTTAAVQAYWQDIWGTPGDRVQPNLPLWSIAYHGTPLPGFEGTR